MKTQIELLEKYGVKNYSIENDKIVINGDLNLYSLKEVHKDFLANTTINGGLNLTSLKEVDKDFLANTTINGGLYLYSLKKADKDFLANTKINGYLNLNSLIEADKDFLANTKINGNLYLNSLTEVDKDFLSNTKINGWLDLNSLTKADKDFLSNTKINGGLDLSSLTEVDKDFLANTIINGNLYLNSLKKADKDFLSNTKINGWLDLSSLKKADKLILKNNIKKLTNGYFPKQNYCFFDNILSEVISVKSINDYTVYLTPFNYIVQKGNHTAHAESIEKGIKDVEFKILTEKIKNEPLTKDSILNLDKYRIITGACELGCKNWMRNNGLSEDTEIRVGDLVPMLEESRAYGLDKVKGLMVD